MIVEAVAVAGEGIEGKAVGVAAVAAGRVIRAGAGDRVGSRRA